MSPPPPNFIVSLKPLLCHIRAHPDIKSLNCGRDSHKVMAYADDLMFFATQPETTMPVLLHEHEANMFRLCTSLKELPVLMGNYRNQVFGGLQLPTLLALICSDLKVETNSPICGLGEIMY